MSSDGLPTRIMMTSDSIGGVWTYVLDLARWLGHRGIEVVVVNMGRASTRVQRREASSIPTLSLVELPLKLEWMDDPWSEVEQAGERLLELERLHRPDVVHLSGYAHGALPFAAPKLVVAHSCIASWWQAVHGVPAPASYDVYRARVARGLRSADAVVCVSRFMQQALADHYDFRGPSRVIHNGCDAASLMPDFKEELVFSAGRFWDAAKNLAVLNAAAPEISWPVVAAGDDTRPPGAAGDPLLFPDHVHLLGRLSRAETAAWLGKAAIFALPARYEPFGLSVLEAALSGCALVLGDIPSLRELWDGAALFVQPDDERGLAVAIAGLVSQPALRAQLASEAARRGKRWSMQTMLDQYLSVYQSMLKPSASANAVERSGIAVGSTAPSDRREEAP